MKVIIDFKIESESKGTCMKNEIRSEITDLFWLSRYIVFLSSAWKNPRTLVVILFSDFCCLLGQITKKNTRIFGVIPFIRTHQRCYHSSKHWTRQKQMSGLALHLIFRRLPVV